MAIKDKDLTDTTEPMKIIPDAEAMAADVEAMTEEFRREHPQLGDSAPRETVHRSAPREKPSDFANLSKEEIATRFNDLLRKKQEERNYAEAGQEVKIEEEEFEFARQVVAFLGWAIEQNTKELSHLLKDIKASPVFPNTLAFTIYRTMHDIFKRLGQDKVKSTFAEIHSLERKRDQLGIFWREALRLRFLRNQLSVGTRLPRLFGTYIEDHIGVEGLHIKETAPLRPGAPVDLFGWTAIDPKGPLAQVDEELKRLLKTHEVKKAKHIELEIKRLVIIRALKEMEVFNRGEKPREIETRHFDDLNL